MPSETPYGAHMDIGQYGDLNTLQWVANEFDPSPDMLHCEVVYGEWSYLGDFTHPRANIQTLCGHCAMWAQTL